jgi:2-oxoglutarate dehydrogenase E1 component
MARELERNTFLASNNSAFLEDLYCRYTSDAASVDPGWRQFFDEMADEAPLVMRAARGASWAPRRSHVVVNGDGGGNGLAEAEPPARTGGAGAAEIRAATLDSIRALMMIRAYRVRGHLFARLDPLDIEEKLSHEELEPESYGFSEADYDREIFIDNVLGLDNPTLREIVQTVRETYCGTIGVEFMHITSAEEKRWIQARIESAHNRTAFTDLGRRTILERLSEAEIFETFLHVKYPGTKRFGLDGAESLIPALEQILKRGSQLGIEEVVIGLPHRGRLNVLANVMGKPFTAIFSEFQGESAKPEDVQGSGDVKYHLGTSSDREFDGKVVHLSLSPNPSHLEAVDPVVVGKVRAKQRQRNDPERRRVMALLMHGDAAFSGQGIVAETFGLSDIKGYRTGGTIHFVVNNQVGFTTNPRLTRASRYPTEMAKMVQAPIFHVNGDDIEAVVHVARIATEFRQTFRKDVVIDMWCYRRHGHNEGDEPAFTQPLMYQAIAGHPTIREVYADKLVGDGLLGRDDADAIAAACRQRLDECFEASKTYKPNKADWLEGAWSQISVAPTLEERRGKTGLPVETLKRIGEAITRVPDGFTLHKRLERVLGARRKMIEDGEGLDWSTAEALAFGTLVTEGYFVRLSGQDCGRGTFSQRHAVLVDQQTEDRFIPLDNITPDQARFVVRDSPLAEASVLGFEYGISLADPDALIMWEAQFGDFTNGAQFIIDQFISSGESKWLRMSGLVMLLPHGHEGQGPEHSSARPERFLQMCGEDNMQVVNPTTPANFFHVLRRQIHRNFRKPLVVMTPKSLLRHKGCVSGFEDMAPGTVFHRVLSDDGELIPDHKVKRVVLCSGKVYYDLAAERDKRGIRHIALVRLEQLYPFPHISLGRQLERYANAEVVWCQEEPRNMGAWNFVDRRIEDLLATLDVKAARPVYVGRAEAAAPATGLSRRHVKEQTRLVDQALTLG